MKWEIRKKKWKWNEIPLKKYGIHWKECKMSKKVNRFKRKQAMQIDKNMGKTQTMLITS